MPTIANRLATPEEAAMPTADATVLGQLEPVGVVDRPSASGRPLALANVEKLFIEKRTRRDQARPLGHDEMARLADIGVRLRRAHRRAALRQPGIQRVLARKAQPN